MVSEDVVRAKKTTSIYPSLGFGWLYRAVFGSVDVELWTIGGCGSQMIYSYSVLNVSSVWSGEMGSGSCEQPQ